MRPKKVVVSAHNILRQEAEIKAFERDIEGRRAAAKIDDSGRCRLYGRFVKAETYDMFVMGIAQDEECLEGLQQALKDLKRQMAAQAQERAKRPKKPKPKRQHRGRTHSGTDKFESPFAGLASYMRNKE